MDSEGLDPGDFIAHLRNKRFALVYSDRFQGSLEETWYHRWKTNVIALFSYGVEALQGVPTFFNVDQIVSHFSHQHEAGNVDYILNLNAGNRFLDNWALVPALGRWRRVPVFPCDALTVLMGERKDTAKSLAALNGWRVPASAGSVSDPEMDIVEKPMTFGSSVGLRRLSLRDYWAHGPRPDALAEAFVPGYDATIVVLYSMVDQALVCTGAMVHVPDRADPEEWIYDAYEKRHPGVRTQVEQRFCAVTPELAAMTIKLVEAFHVTAVARVDVRLDRLPNAGEPIDLAACTFLEINPMPTIAPGTSVLAFAKDYLNANEAAPELSGIISAPADDDTRAAAYVIAAGLFSRLGAN